MTIEEFKRDLEQFTITPDIPSTNSMKTHADILEVHRWYMSTYGKSRRCPCTYCVRAK